VSLIRLGSAGASCCRISFCFLGSPGGCFCWCLGGWVGVGPLGGSWREEEGIGWNFGRLETVCVYMYRCWCMCMCMCMHMCMCMCMYVCVHVHVHVHVCVCACVRVHVCGYNTTEIKK
jgi:hypothetical protein